MLNVSPPTVGAVAAVARWRAFDINNITFCAPRE